MARDSFGIGTVRIRPGTSRNLELPITRPVTGSDVSLPVRVVHGREDGPTVWLSAAIHGDEVVGVEVIRQCSRGWTPRPSGARSSPYPWSMSRAS
ncbi:succinylglutamate desuccinylase/aspartoacylase family protein [Nocardioides sp. B-3]|uniref:succinylglutamate desuccinylase/aspartoacylase family protein n=1 Tax=Nocardioides sp. B-3 TaxID=2895565 RepID=UPI002152CE18|nr:succinylglutamate desuccinylase/aspartoacylase family protein [Nocardioides sp. B-3]UUZ61170.1 succinylglutamate desuccinylase/aspartoacylase family protein [Nocardioides sp. B-3]